MSDALFAILVQVWIALYIGRWIGHRINEGEKRRTEPPQGTTARAFYELNEALRGLWHTILDALTTKPEQ